MLNFYREKRTGFAQVLMPGLLFVFSAAYAQASTLEEVTQLANTGAVHLALRVVDREQANLNDSPQAWMQWEKARIELYQSRQDWQSISTRLVNLPQFCTVEFTKWASTERARAFIALGQGMEARQELRKLIWHSRDDTGQNDSMHAWQELVIQSYLADGLADDAQTATLRFQQEYGVVEQDILLRARIAILNKRYNEAVELLASHADEPRAGALLLLATLRGKLQPASKVVQSTLQHLRSKEIDNEMRVNLWAVASEAANVNKQYAVAANALEHILAQKKYLSLPDSIIEINNEKLFSAYLDYALMLGNKNHLLIGQDDKWLEYAVSIQKKHPVGARAMNIFVMLRGQNVTEQNKAAGNFVELVTKRQHGKSLLRAMFEKSKYYSDKATIPEPVRHILVDLALADSDIDLASELMASIRKPPEDSDQFMWLLRRARILVLGSRIKDGIAALNDMLDSYTELEPIQFDRFMQVIFDLQTAGEHEAAYQLFDRIWSRTTDQKIQREIFFWMADSRKAQEKYAMAAELYLKSAMYPDPENMDPWAQTAHYQAADALVKAGMYEDAQYLFEHLLRVTEEPSRRAVLKRELQKLWAKQ